MRAAYFHVTLDLVTRTSGDFELTPDELRAVVHFVHASAQAVLPVFEAAVPGDERPRAAAAAAQQFVEGAPRSRLQRQTSTDAHRAAGSAPTESATLAARAAGDAASAAYLHPIAKAHQVGHILRAAACAARIAEIEAGDDPAVGAAAIEKARLRATPAVIDVLLRYPPAPSGGNRIAQLMATLDAALRADPAGGAG